MSGRFFTAQTAGFPHSFNRLVFHQTNTLTTRSDEFTGDAGDDTFDATTAGELNSSDDLTGGAGTDTLDATIATVVAPTLAGIENLIIQSTADAADIDLAGADTSITSITVTTSATDLDILNMQNNATFTLIDVTSAATGLTLDFDDDALGTDEAALVINTDGSTVAIDTVVGGDDDITSITFNATGSDSAITMDLTDITSVTFTGSADLSLLVAGNGFTEITSITGTAATGGLTIDLDDNAAAYSINLGSGDDSIVADQANTGTGGRTINMGAGDDTLNLGALAPESDDVFNGGAGAADTLIITDTSNITVAATAGISGFERLTLTEAATLDMNDFSDRGAQFTTIRADSTTDSAALVITNAGASVTTLELDAVNAADGNADPDEDVSFARLVNGTADVLNVIVTATAGAQLGDELIVDGEETVTLNVATGALTLNTGISATQMTSLTVVGDSNVDMSALDAPALATLDLTGMSGTATFTSTSTTSVVAMTVTGGTSTGTVTVTTGTGNDIITAGSGAIAVTTGVGNDTVTGGALADTINTGAGHDIIVTGNGGGTVTAGTGNDTINVTNTTAIEDVIVFAEYGQGNYDIITGFTVGTAATADELTMTAANMGWTDIAGNTAAVFDTGASIKAAVTGVTDTTVITISTDMAANSIDGLIAGTVSYADFLSAGAAAMGLTGDADGAAVYAVFVDDGEHTALFRFVSSDAAVDDLTTASELELVSIFVGVTDATALVAENVNAF